MKCISYLIYPSITLLSAILKLITLINRPPLWKLMTSLAVLSTPDLTYRVRREAVRYQMTSHLWRTAAVNHCWYLHHDHIHPVLTYITAHSRQAIVDKLARDRAPVPSFGYPADRCLPVSVTAGIEHQEYSPLSCAYTTAGQHQCVVLYWYCFCQVSVRSPSLVV